MTKQIRTAAGEEVKRLDQISSRHIISYMPIPNALPSFAKQDDGPPSRHPYFFTHLPLGMPNKPPPWPCSLVPKQLLFPHLDFGGGSAVLPQ
jgi:hypothetical protein